MLNQLRWTFLPACLIALACSQEPAQITSNQSEDAGRVGVLVADCSNPSLPDPDGEGEFFGRFYDHGVRVCGSGSVSLTPDAATSLKYQGTAFKPTLQYEQGYLGFVFNWDFEWWDPVASDGPCHGFLSNTQDLEVHPKDPGYGTTLEGHCILPGRYTFMGNGRLMEIDYLSQTTPGSGFVTNTTTNPVTQELVEDVAQTHCQACQREYILHIDQGPLVTGNMALDVDATVPGEDPQHVTFDGSIPAEGDMKVTYRFSTAGTSSSYHYAQGGWLARLYWDYTGNQSDRTGFYDVASGFSLIRLHNFPNPSTNTRTYTVALGVVRPTDLIEDEHITTTQIVIRRINPNLKTNSLNAASNVAAGATIPVTVVAKNWGPGPAEAGWNAKVYLSQDSVFNRNQDLPLTGGTTPAFGPLDVNDTDSRVANVTISLGQTPGNYTLFAEVDGSFAVIEDTPGGPLEADNHLGRPITITAASGPPDLTPNPVTVSRTTVSQGSSLTVTVHERNDGNSSAPAGWAGKVYLSANTQCCTGDVLLQTYTETNAIAAGQFRDNVRTVTIPTNTAWGTYYIIAHLDANNIIAEGAIGETNNIGTSAQITVGPCQFTGTPPGGEWDVGETATFTPVIAANCGSRYLTITPVNGVAGFTTQSNCTATTFIYNSTNPVVRACVNGVTSLKVYRIQGGPLEQTISIGVGQL